MEISAIALQGVQQAQAGFEKAVARVSEATTSPSADVVDLSAGIVGMMEAQRAFEANLEIPKTAFEMTGNVIDVVG